MRMRSDDPFEVMRAIDDRYDLLRLLEDDRLDKPGLVAELGTSRSTVDRALARLVDEHIVHRTSEGYTLTYPGTKLKECYEACLANIEPVRETNELLTNLPSDLDLPVEVVRDSDVFEADRYEPGLPQRRFLELVDESEQLWGIAPVTNEQYVDTLHRRVVIEERWTEVVTEDEIVDYLLETYPRTFRDVLGSENCKLYSHNGQLQYGLALFEGDSRCMALGVYDPEKHIRGLLVAFTDTAVEWACDHYDTIRKQSTCVGPERAKLNG